MLSGEEKEEEQICRLSHPGHPHTLSRRDGTDPPDGCFAGGYESGAYESLGGLEKFYHYCTTCDVAFHKYCHEKPRKITHPYHPQHSLSFSVIDRETRVLYDRDPHEYNNGKIYFGVGTPYHGNTFDNCTWCGENLRGGTFFYRCSICSFCLCPLCSFKFPLPTISNPKNHHHSLIFLPRPLLVPCDVCGLVERSDPSYVCFQCNYVVHESCIDLPCVIKITRHPHRLFYTPFLSPSISSCLLCYKTIDIKYGQYSCNHEDCSYVAHSKCATHETVWDGRELEWEPEEIGETEDVAPFKRVGDHLIKYFFHEHHLKLEKYNGVRDADKQCQACILHIDSRDFYNCMQCNYFLHEVCANLPRKLDHALHNHPLFLDPAPPKDFESIDCFVCRRPFAGFSYKCYKDNCEDEYGIKFQVDFGCILIPECFTHKSHEHPLFIPIATKRSNRCEVCKAENAARYLRCTLCEFCLCYECAIIPDKLHYKYDALPLSLCYGEVSDETYWCEVCERKLDPKEWFYTCNKANITIHCECVFGKFAYMNPGYKFDDIRSSTVEVICNRSSTRPFCNECKARCSSSVYLKMSNGTVVCSILCYLWKR
ncbi:putative chromatin regulator PHD family [Arabidopsis thaliana]|uniref:Cysteine/Histidine-rich C1 domain family protein n=1 Tax=Arabidopsis thaliana TaxID=3702 RepID=A0A178VSI3_ARATH|nr:hypothetical protein AXX17_AT2G12870 [Arabidopsis thaliana]CAA0364322.1 unnamed protein product [Arabidopsis thaliana]